MKEVALNWSLKQKGSENSERNVQGRRNCMKAATKNFDGDHEAHVFKTLENIVAKV